MASHPDEPFLVPAIFPVEVVAAFARRGESRAMLDAVEAHVRGLRSSRGWPFAFEYSWRTCGVNATTAKESRD